MDNHSINSLFSILIDALAGADASINVYEIMKHVSKAQEAFKAEVLKSLPELTPQEQILAQSDETWIRIQAIKAFRGRTKCSLADAKAKTDSVYDAHKGYNR